MKQITILDKSDIEKIIAQYFHTPISSVKLALVKTYGGHGLGEHKDWKIEATITHTMEVKNDE